MTHRIEVQMCVGPAGIRACWSQTTGVKSLSDKQNNPERFPNDPVLKIQNAKPGKSEET
jgi:hypothetical protein